MNQASDDGEEMRPEYDIRGGERGKYFERYAEVAEVVTVSVTFEDSTLITTSTASTPSVGSVARAAVYPPAYPSPRIEGIETAAA
jgi:hypothetical protein